MAKVTPIAPFPGEVLQGPRFAIALHEALPNTHIFNSVRKVLEDTRIAIVPQNIFRRRPI